MRKIDEIKADIRYVNEETKDRHKDCHGVIDYILCELDKELRAAYTDGIPLDRLEEICNAEREGRLVVLPQVGERGDISDGFHTFDELYEQRAVLFSALCRLFPGGAWKSKFHSDGTMFDGCFIVGIETPEGSYTYHYGITKWDWFPVRVIEVAPEWDGHTDKDVRRLWSLAPCCEAAEAAQEGKE